MDLWFKAGEGSVQRFVPKCHIVDLEASNRVVGSGDFSQTDVEMYKLSPTL